MTSLKIGQIAGIVRAACVAFAMVLVVSAASGTASAADVKAVGAQTMSADEISNQLSAPDKGGFKTRGIRRHSTSSGKVDLKIYFASGSDTIDAKSHRQLGEIAKALNSSALNKAKIRIEGHTDSVGDEAYNMDLSKRRAASIKKFLVQTHGVAAGRLDTVGKGESEPVASNATSDGRARNRRVTLVKVSGGS